MIKFSKSMGSICKYKQSTILNYSKLIHYLNLIKTYTDISRFPRFSFPGFLIYNSILFSSPLVLLSNLDLHGFSFRVFFLSPHYQCLSRNACISILCAKNNFGIKFQQLRLPPLQCIALIA